MDRRSFLTFISASGERASAQEKPVARPLITGGIEPYTTPLDAAQAYHLLRRISFAPKSALVKQFIGKTAEQAVESLLGDGSNIQPTPPTWIDEITENPKNADMFTKNSIESRWVGLFGQLQYWWLNEMYKESTSAIEKLTLFWSSHFTTEFAFDEGYLPPQQLYRQNALLRRNRLSNFRNFAEDITLDSAMLVYLGGVLNTNKKANENYARELMELFTIGIGHYSEGDVKEAARVLTGWKAALYKDEPARNEFYNTWFLPTDHDVQAKTIMGQTIPARVQDDNTEYLVRSQEVRKLIEILFERKPMEIGRFISKKLYRYFVYSNPDVTDQTFIEDMANIMVENDFSLRPVIAALFKSAHFFDAANRGVQIKTPAEFTVGFARQIGKLPANIGTAMAEEEQTLIDPPNVSGWPGWHVWLNTKTYPNRVIFARTVLTAMTTDELLAFANSFDTVKDSSALLDDIVMNFLPKAINQKRRDTYYELLMQGYQANYWQQMLAEKDPAARGLRALLTAIIKSPDYQLC